MNNVTSDFYFNKLNNLLATLKPDLMMIKEITQQIIKIDSPYKEQFVYLKMLAHVQEHNKQEVVDDRRINLILEELHLFGELLEKILADDQFRDLYIKTGLLDQLIVLQKNITDKVNCQIQQPHLG